jgi:hypothetical protein
MNVRATTNHTNEKERKKANNLLTRQSSKHSIEINLAGLLAIDIVGKAADDGEIDRSLRR